MMAADGKQLLRDKGLQAGRRGVFLRALRVILVTIKSQIPVIQQSPF